MRRLNPFAWSLPLWGQLACLVACLAWSSVALAQPKIERGVVKSLDLEKRILVVTSDGRERTLAISTETRVLDNGGRTLAEKFADFKPGSELQFVAAAADGGEKAEAVKLAKRDDPRGGGGQGGAPVSPDHKHFKPLTELGTEQYQGFAGGLYAEGKNERPAAHEAAGLARARKIQPLDLQGRPDPQGKVVLLSLGMSNTSQVSEGFRSHLQQASGLHGSFRFVNGAQGGMTAESIVDPEDGNRGQRYWEEVDRRLEQAGLSRQQVQAVWIKQADAVPRQGFPGYARKLQGELRRIVQVVQARFPQVQLAYLSSRTYGGFATTGLNPEPVAYESGFAVKWLIEEQLSGSPELNYDPSRGAVKAPWLSWGPYLWANGQTRRADGFFYEPADFSGDGTHHANSGTRKTGKLLLDFFTTDSTTRPWVLAAEK